MLKYKENTDDWWNFLIRNSSSDSDIAKLYGLSKTLDENRVEYVNKKLFVYFKKYFLSSRMDGGYKHIVDNNKNGLNYMITTIGNLLGMQPLINDRERYITALFTVYNRNRFTPISLT